MNFSSGLINFCELEQLTQFRKVFYLIDDWFIIKGYNSGTARWKRYIKQDSKWEEARGFHALSGHITLPTSPCVHQPGSSLNPVLWGFIETSSHYMGTID